MRGEVLALLASFDEASEFMETPPVDIESIEGRRIGHYEILSLLGAGGMGEVYLARDTRLDRQVALKLLPLTQDQSLVQRFEREARAASALNHPNIITVYETGREGDAHFIATEFVEGRTLRQKIADGKIEAREAAAIAAQIATALQAAHRAGIVHRDIKPENIMLRPDGLIKVLDFGLAKLTGARSAECGMPNEEEGSAFRAPHLQTDHATLMGTVAYLSPEQARGNKSDHRADLFSLGVVIYEMISQQRPFRGDSTAAILDAIINHQPAPADAPPTMERIIRRALAKDVEARYQTTDEMLDDLRRFADESHRKRARRRALAAVIALVLVAIVSFALLRWGDEKKEIRFPWSDARSVMLTDDAGEEVFPSLAPDGGSFVYASRAAGNWDIYLQRVDERVGVRKPVNLTAGFAGDDTQPAFSPDGKWIAFRSSHEGGGIFLMSYEGQTVRRLSDEGFHPAWSPDGEEILCTDENITSPINRIVRARRLWAIKVATGERRLITTEDVAQPQWSPRQYRIAYWGQRANAQRDIWTMTAAGDEVVEVTNDEATDWNPVWSPDGRYLYFASDRSGGMKLWRVEIDERSGRVLREPELVPTPSAWSQHISFSRDGARMIYAQVITQTNVQSVAFDPRRGKLTGEPKRITQGSQMISGVDVSADGRWLACDSIGEDRESIFLLRSDGTGGRHLLTTDDYKYRNPQFSPDGKRLAFYSNRSGYWEVWIMKADGSDLRQLTFTMEESAFYPIWSPDGKRIAYTTRGGVPFIIEVERAWAEQTPQPAVSSSESAHFWPRAWSEDGKRLIGGWRKTDNAPPTIISSYSLESHRFEHFAEFTGSVPGRGGDENSLIFRAGGNLFLGDKRRGRARSLLALAPDQVVNFALSADRRTLYFTLKETRADIWMLALK
jgi:Tol biopolymer transport system component